MNAIQSDERDLPHHWHTFVTNAGRSVHPDRRAIRGVRTPAGHAGTHDPTPPSIARFRPSRSGSTGVVTAAQIRAAGLSTSGISDRVKRGALHRRSIAASTRSGMRRAVAVRASVLAAVLAAGAGAALSHDSCAELFEVRRWPARAIHVSAPRRHARIAGVVTHRTPLRPLDVIRLSRHPGHERRAAARRPDRRHRRPTRSSSVISEAAWRKRFDLEATRAALERANGRQQPVASSKGDRALARAARSRAEEPQRARVPAAGARRTASRVRCPTPTSTGEEVDAHWPERSLMVEVDGHGHRRPAQQTRRRRRDAKLARGGLDGAARHAPAEVEHPARTGTQHSSTCVGLGRNRGL